MTNELNLYIRELNVADKLYAVTALGTSPSIVHRVSFQNWKIDGCPHHGPTIANQKDRLHMSWFNDAAQASGLFYTYTDD